MKEKKVYNLNFGPMAIDKVYRGTPNRCMCGCAGRYYYRDIKETEDWQLDDKTQEGNTKRVLAILKKARKFTRLQGAEVLDDNIFTVVGGKTQYTIYLRK